MAKDWLADEEGSTNADSQPGSWGLNPERLQRAANMLRAHVVSLQGDDKDELVCYANWLQHLNDSLVCQPPRFATQAFKMDQLIKSVLFSVSAQCYRDAFGDASGYQGVCSY